MDILFLISLPCETAPGNSATVANLAGLNDVTAVIAVVLMCHSLFHPIKSSHTNLTFENSELWFCRVALLVFLGFFKLS